MLAILMGHPYIVYRWREGFIFSIAAMLMACGLGACSPAYNWRTLENRADGYTVALPARPRVDERMLSMAGISMKMRMQTASVQGVTFAIGAVMLPNDDPQVQRLALDYLSMGLAHHLNVTRDMRATAIPVATGGMIEGFEMDASGRIGEMHEHKTIQAWFVARGRHVYQLIMIAGGPVAQEQQEQFFRSFELF